MRAYWVVWILQLVLLLITVLTVAEFLRNRRRLRVQRAEADRQRQARDAEHDQWLAQARIRGQEVREQLVVAQQQWSQVEPLAQDALRRAAEIGVPKS